MNIKYRIIIIIILTIIESIMCYYYFKNNNLVLNNKNISNYNLYTNNKTNNISATAQIESALTENIELHNTYYIEQVYVEENQLVKQGTKILKYTNGIYLLAPYDLIITKMNIPSSTEMINNKYISVISYNNLCVQIKVDETNINKISIGKSATIKINSIDSEINGVITNISNTASNGKFSVTIQFSNTKNIMVGMSAKVTI